MDAENIMPLATSDFRNPVCQEMRFLRFSNSGGNGGSGAEHLGSSLVESKLSPSDIQPSEILSFTKIYNEQGYNYTKSYNEQGSIDSSDTYASCQTHPSHSQGDLTEEADSNLYINPMEATEKCRSQMKKSVSGEVGRNITTDMSPSAGSLKEASKAKLNDIMIPKHRKIRIQQNMKTRIQLVSDQKSIVRSILRDDTAMEDNNNHYGGLRGGKSSPFVSTNSLTSATRIINYRMFGSLSAPKRYKGKIFRCIQITLKNNLF
ncbi:PREDICTED: uncharacterized protein LOC105557911 [Vollenhovia emeryi]|uniref:uncharacterized protein LOC105557911 n=1 Tax=Vollenhovia emeryi TaxID=411798 RepID=UPI0005F48386|nr:PREDICTED: uncharacterized protein LOC105557911 [Vollenhovia emeryi]